MVSEARAKAEIWALRLVGRCCTMVARMTGEGPHGPRTKIGNIKERNGDLGYASEARRLISTCLAAGRRP